MLCGRTSPSSATPSLLAADTPPTFFLSRPVTLPCLLLAPHVPRMKTVFDTTLSSWPSGIKMCEQGKIQLQDCDHLSDRPSLERLLLEPSYGLGDRFLRFKPPPRFWTGDWFVLPCPHLCAGLRLLLKDRLLFSGTTLALISSSTIL